MNQYRLLSESDTFTRNDEYYDAQQNAWTRIVEDDIGVPPNGVTLFRREIIGFSDLVFLSPFDLERAKDGVTLITRGGRLAEFLTDGITSVKFGAFNASIQNFHPIACLVDGDILYYTKKGYYTSNTEEHRNDLFIA